MIRKDTNPTPLNLPPEMQDLLMRNGMRAQLAGSSNGFQLIVQGHDSPVLSYPITQNQLKAMTEWGTNYANKRCYNTFASIVAADFDMPKDFVHARNANGRVAMGLHGYRIGVGEYGRIPHNRHPLHHHGHPFSPHHMWGDRFLGWTPRNQEGFHLRRINGGLYYPAGAPMVANRPDGRMKPGELQNGGYGFYYKGQQAVQPVANQDVLRDLGLIIPSREVGPRSMEPAKPYKELITSDVYFSAEKWQECLKSHDIIYDPATKTLTIQSAATEVDFQYNLTEEESKAFENNSLKEMSIDKRLEVINGILKDDFKDKVTLDMLNSDKLIAIELRPEVSESLQNSYAESVRINQEKLEKPEYSVQAGEQLPKGTVVMDGNELDYVKDNKGWYREGRHGREVTVDEIRVEPASQEGKYKMTAVIDGEVISHEITKKQYDKFLNLDDYHRMRLFAKIFPEVAIKSNGNNVGVGTQIGAALLAGLTVAHEIGHHHPPMAPDLYMEHHHHGPEPRVYFKPGVDTPMDVAARHFDAAMNAEMIHNEIHR